MLTARRILFSVLFIASTILFLSGLLSHDLLKQSVWDPSGIRKLLGFLLLFFLICSVAWKHSARKTLIIISACGLFYTFAAAGPIALIGVLYFLLSSWCLGLLLKTDGWIATAVGISLHAWIIGILVFLPVNYPLTYTALFAIPIYFARKKLQERSSEFGQWIRRKREPDFSTYAASVLLAACLILHLLVSMKPETSHDGLAMHLAIPASIAVHHQFTFQPQETLWAAMPMMGDWSFTAVYLLGGELASRLLNFSFLIILTGMLHQALRRFLPQSLSIFLAALFASSPLIQLLIGSLFVENFWAMNLLAIFLLADLYWGSGKIHYALLAAVMMGISIATKFGSLGFIVPVLAFILVSAIRRKHFRWIAGLLACLLAFGVPHYARAYLQTGNPVFPFLNHIFQSPYFNTSDQPIDLRFHDGVSLTSLFDITFNTEQFLEGFNGGFAFQFIFFIPIAIIALFWRRNALTVTALMTASIFFFTSMNSMSNARYIYPAFPLLTLLIANLFAELRLNFQRLFQCALTATILLLGLNLWFLPASGWYHRDLAPIYVFQHQKWVTYRDMRSPERALIDYLNQTYPAQPVAFIDTNAIAGLKGKAYTTTWHNTPFRDKVYALKSIEECFELFDGLGIELLVVPADLHSLPHSPEHHFQVSFSEPEKVSTTWKLVRLMRPATLSSSQEPLDFVLGIGDYDDTDFRLMYQGAWLPFTTTQSSNNTLTYSNDPQATVRSKFAGTALTFYFTRTHNRGIGRIIIDGEETRKIDGYSHDTSWKAREDFGGLEPGIHTFELQVTTEKNPLSSNTYFDIDGLAVR